jgi:Protein of unknown function (DUF1203)
MNQMTYRIEAISPDLIDEVRATGRDASGNSPVALRANGNEPLRCCLRNAEKNEAILLFGYEPLLPAPTPYREVGAVYVHAERCGGWNDDQSYPTDWYGRQQVLRAYDRNGWIRPATRVHDGKDPEAVLGQMLAEPDVVEVHSRNIAYGCFMFVARR